MSVPRVLLLVLALLQAGGAFDVLRRELCEQTCRRDGCDAPCSPDEDAPQCSCHLPSATSLAAASVPCVTVVPAAVAVVSFGPVDRQPASPDPREILHVPRRAA